MKTRFVEFLKRWQLLDAAFYFRFSLWWLLSWTQTSLTHKFRILETSNSLRNSHNRDTSYGNEFESVSTLLNAIQSKSDFLVDIGAADGVMASTTMPLLKKGWQGVLIEGDPHRFRRLAAVSEDWTAVDLVRATVTPTNISTLLNSLSVPLNVDLVNIDIDSFDLHVVDQMLSGGYRPKLLSMEVNEIIPPEIWFSVLPTFAYAEAEDHFFGCSLTAAEDVLGRHNYELVGFELNNAFFMPGELVTRSGLSALSVEEAYTTGYLEHPERDRYFNQSAFFIGLTSDQGESTFDSLNSLFQKYHGYYELRLLRDHEIDEGVS